MEFTKNHFSTFEDDLKGDIMCLNKLVQDFVAAKVPHHSLPFRHDSTLQNLDDAKKGERSSTTKSEDKRKTLAVLAHIPIASPSTRAPNPLVAPISTSFISTIPLLVVVLRTLEKVYKDCKDDSLLVQKVATADYDEVDDDVVVNDTTYCRRYLLDAYKGKEWNEENSIGYNTTLTSARRTHLSLYFLSLLSLSKLTAKNRNFLSSLQKEKIEDDLSLKKVKVLT
ncbi:hypothetical protein L6452_34730 [Arctium lappa]|uniref:Uncharacterized protein n=1 Tax=Arctium lappa TaxID=4217 RepID=A0ACB8YI92_ARCLA|nr:hypothetical protein L6452_34730 [Arctium lappa]